MSTHTATNATLEKAYKTLLHRIRNGWDFADACFNAASAEGVMYEDLADFYDAKCAD
jgi:hypothetical protein